MRPGGPWADRKDDEQGRPSSGCRSASGDARKQRSGASLPSKLGTTRANSESRRVGTRVIKAN